MDTEEIDKFANKLINKYGRSKIIDRNINLDLKDKILLDDLFRNSPKELDEAFRKHGISLLDWDLNKILGVINKEAFRPILERAKLEITGVSEEGVILDKIKVTRKPMMVDINNLIYEKAKKVETDGSYSKKTSGRIYQANWAEGNFSIYLLFGPSETLHVGNGQELYLKRARDDEITQFFNTERIEEETILRKIMKNHHLLDAQGYPKDSSEMMERLLNEHNQDPIFFIPTLPITKEELLKIEDFDEMMDLALTAGLEKDEKLVYIFRTLIPIPVGDPSYIDPANFMSSSSNIIIITKTKPGKTTTGRKVGKVFDRPSVANLLGFSIPSQKTVEGRLNQETRPIMIDGIEEEPDAEMAMGLLNYMETGIVDIARGRGVKTIGYSPLIFSSNPSKMSNKGYNSIDEEGMLPILDNILGALHRNLQGFGSRIGCFIFDPAMKNARGNRMSSFKERGLEKFLYSIQEVLRLPFTKLVNNERIDNWLSSIDDRIEDYQKELRKLLKDGNIRAYSRIYSFIDGFIDGFRHAKGMALRASIMDHLKDLIEMDEDENFSGAFVHSILKRAKEHLNRIISINLESFIVLSDILEKEDIMKMVYESRYDSIRARGSKYEEFLLECAARWYLKQSNPKEGIAISIIDLKEEYFGISKERRDRSRYQTFNKLLDVVERSVRKINSHKAWLGFSLQKIDDILILKFDEKREWFAWIDEKIGSLNPRPMTQTTHMTHEDNEIMGQMGQKGRGSSNERGKNSNEIVSDIASFVTIKSNHIEWGYNLLSDHPGMPKEAFIKEFLGVWGPSFRGDEIDRLYDILKKRLEKENATT